MIPRKTYIERLIERGENQRQDFKFEVSDSKKIARSISAFANTEGGKLLVGVKDNGVVAGIRSDEEIHMLQAAAQLYCRPEVALKFTQWQVEGKKVLEVDISKTIDDLIMAPDRNDVYKVFVRVADENILANGIFIKNWKQKKAGRSVDIQYTDTEKAFIQTLETSQPINFSQLRRKLNVSPPKLNQLILDFMMIDIVELKITEKAYFYKLV
ncbi:MAG: ATP-binding protein [Bacteroidales bacterium]|nr:ATP-binding protein [Bacteroidales bacterium]